MELSSIHFNLRYAAAREALALDVCGFLNNLKCILPAQDRAEPGAVTQVDYQTAELEVLSIGGCVHAA